MGRGHGLSAASWMAMLTLGLVLGASQAAHAKMYKWVDADGKTHYTQTPPPESARTTEQMNVRSSTVVKVRKKGKHLYCGSARLPKLRKKAAIDIANLESSILGWEERIILTKENRSKYIQGNVRRVTSKSYKDRLRRFEEKLAETQCQLDWGRTELVSLEGERADIVKHHADLKQLEAQLVARKVTECGADNRQGIVVVDDAYRQYQRCIRPFDREIRKLRTRIRKAGREVELVSEQ